MRAIPNIELGTEAILCPSDPCRLCPSDRTGGMDPSLLPCAKLPNVHRSRSGLAERNEEIKRRHLEAAASHRDWMASEGRIVNAINRNDRINREAIIGSITPTEDAPVLEDNITLPAAPSTVMPNDRAIRAEAQVRRFPYRPDRDRLPPIARSRLYLARSGTAPPARPPRRPLARPPRRPLAAAPPARDHPSPTAHADRCRSLFRLAAPQAQARRCR